MCNFTSIHDKKLQPTLYFEMNSFNKKVFAGAIFNMVPYKNT